VARNANAHDFDSARALSPPTLLESIGEACCAVARNKYAWLGLLAGVITALIGASWQVISRSAAATPLGPVELAVLRYAIPAALLLPITLRGGLLPPAVPLRTLILLVSGAGLPFGLLVFAGSRFAPAAHMGILIAATGPLMTSALLWLIDRTRISAQRGAGLALIAAGVAMLSAYRISASDHTWIGDVFFVLAALLWSGYGIAFRKTALTPWQCAAIVNAWSAVAILPVAAFVGVEGFARADASLLALHVLWQGVIAGVFGLVAYTVAVRSLGASRAAAFGALVPVLATLGGSLWLDEAITAVSAIASLLATAGVALAVGPEFRRDKKVVT
jgi:drug/metabolite transporter (DMT)-like permease